MHNLNTVGQVERPRPVDHVLRTFLDDSAGGGGTTQTTWVWVNVVSASVSFSVSVLSLYLWLCRFLCRICTHLCNNTETNATRVHTFTHSDIKGVRVHICVHVCVNVCERVYSAYVSVQQLYLCLYQTHTRAQIRTRAHTCQALLMHLGTVLPTASRSVCTGTQAADCSVLGRTCMYQPAARHPSGVDAHLSRYLASAEGLTTIQKKGGDARSRRSGDIDQLGLCDTADQHVLTLLVGELFEGAQIVMMPTAYRWIL